MELREDPLFMGLFAQVQVIDVVLMAAVKTHPRPQELLGEIEQQIALVRSVSATRAADNQIGRLADEQIAQKANGWLAYAREVLDQD